MGCVRHEAEYLGTPLYASVVNVKCTVLLVRLVPSAGKRSRSVEVHGRKEALLAATNVRPAGERCACNIVTMSKSEASAHTGSIVAVSG